MSADRITAEHAAATMQFTVRGVPFIDRLCGYDMDEVDDFLDDMALQLEADAKIRDRIIGVCRRISAGQHLSFPLPSDRILAATILQIVQGQDRTPLALVPLPADVVDVDPAMQTGAGAAPSGFLINTTGTAARWPS